MIKTYRKWRVGIVNGNSSHAKPYTKSYKRDTSQRKSILSTYIVYVTIPLVVISSPRHTFPYVFISFIVLLQVLKYFHIIPLHQFSSHARHHCHIPPPNTIPTSQYCSSHFKSSHIVATHIHLSPSLSCPTIFSSRRSSQFTPSHTHFFPPHLNVSLLRSDGSLSHVYISVRCFSEIPINHPYSRPWAHAPRLAIELKGQAPLDEALKIARSNKNQHMSLTARWSYSSLLQQWLLWKPLQSIMVDKPNGARCGRKCRSHVTISGGLKNHKRGEQYFTYPLKQLQ